MANARNKKMVGLKTEIIMSVFVIKSNAHVSKNKLHKLIKEALKGIPERCIHKIFCLA